MTEEAQQLLYRRILGRVRRHSPQHRLRLLLQRRKLIEHRGVEHGIGSMLERLNPFLLALSDRRPALYRRLRRTSAGLEITADAAEQTVHGSRHPMFAVERDG